MDLTAKIKEYFEVKTLIDSLTASAKQINAEIVSELESRGETKFSTDDLTANLVYKTSIKYNDEQAVINLLKSDAELSKFVVETIDTKNLNDMIKKSDYVAQKLNESYTKSTTASLTVKRL